jgi:small-conductance mechanosensitive channel
MTIKNDINKWVEREALVREVSIQELLNKIIELVDAEFRKIEAYLEKYVSVEVKPEKEGGDKK